MHTPSEGLTQLLDKVMPFHSEIVKSVNTLIKLAASRNKRTLEEADGLRRKEGLARYLSCLSYNHIHLSISKHILFDAQVLLLKPGSTETQSRERGKKWRFFLDFFGGYIPKNTENRPFFGRYHTKNRKLTL